MQKTIFVVDDSVSNLSIAERALEKKYNVITMTSAVKMFSILNKFMPDLILLDVAMPEMSGFDAIKKLKASDLHINIPVIFLTALTDSYNESYGIELGAVDFITKPFSEPVLLHRIKHHLNIEELMRERTERLEHANLASRAKSDFLSTMSHDMRTPLNAIIGMTIIGKKAVNIEEKNRALSKIGEASSHLLGVINDVLDMAKIEANKLGLTLTEYNFEGMLQKVMNVVNFRVDEKKQILTVNVDKNIPHYIIGDEQLLVQAITNLMANAIKFTPKGGRISLDVYMFEKTADTFELRIEVTDSGIGISPEQQEKLFQPFVQVESETSREYGGTGLGLIISKRIIELMDGRIWIESKTGCGAKFIFTIKAQRGKKNFINDYLDADRNQVKGIDDAIDEFSGKKLLLAEDVEINREILVTLLKNTGIEIDCAENGQEALEMITEAPDKYDIVFMDVQMPKMNGYESTRLIRALPALQDIALPIIAMTANVFREDIEACLSAGMDDHLGKPLDINKVIKILRKYID